MADSISALNIITKHRPPEQGEVLSRLHLHTVVVIVVVVRLVILLVPPGEVGGPIDGPDKVTLLLYVIETNPPIGPAIHLIVRFNNSKHILQEMHLIHAKI